MSGKPLIYTLIPSNARADTGKSDATGPGRSVANVEIGHHVRASLRTIGRLRTRLDELERDPGPMPEQIMLRRPYESAGSSRSSTPMSAQEPPTDLRASLIRTFLDRFANGPHFFVDAQSFSQAALNPPSVTNSHRPSAALMQSVYLWGSLLSTSTIPADEFLLAALEHLPADINRLSSNPHGAQSPLMVETIQTTVLLALYYLHEGLPVQGRYHAGAAASLAISAGFNTVATPSAPPPGHPPFLFGATREPGTPDGTRVAAFWASVIVNNEWAAAHGAPAPISSFGTDVDVPWPGGRRTGMTVAKFLAGQDVDGYSPIAFVAKASTLVERVGSVSGNSPNGLDIPTYNTLDQRLDTFHALLPPLSASSSGQDTRTLRIAHSLTDLALIRLHFAHPQVRGARQKALAAAERVVGLIQGVQIQDGEPVFGAACAAAHAVMVHELGALRTGPAMLAPQYHVLEQRLEALMRGMSRLGETSPVMRQCIASTTRSAGQGRGYP
ncbi:hypothetical protein MKEN_01005000 [Mycena kentingensis (nom. inval.)]|nr:hypothetical protein MKEN_01005000 [Mycena kentingensis (nom. inval.)]